MQVPVPLVIVVLLSTAALAQDFRTPIGSPCVSDPVDDGCVTNGECLLSLCQCKIGYSVTSSFTCKLDLGGNCTTSDECNTQMGLQCINSVCSCSNVAQQEYLSELGTCVNSTMKLMYEDIVAFINQTELELAKFSTLLQIFMIHGSPENETSIAVEGSSPQDIQTNAVPSRDLDEQIEAPQEPIPATALPPTSTSTVSDAIPALPAQLPDPPTTTEATTTTTTTTDLPSTTTSPAPIVAPQGVSIPVQPSNSLPNSLNNLIVPILPTQGNSDSPTQAPEVSTSVPLQNQEFNSNSNPQLNELANVLPQFLAMFKEFVPMLQSYNNILSSNLFSIPPSRSGQSNNNNVLNNIAQQGAGIGNTILQNLNPINNIGNTIGGLGSTFGNNLGSLGSTFGNTVGGLGSTFGNTIGSLGSTFGSTVGTLGNTYANTVGGLGSTFGNTVGSLGSTLGNTLGGLASNLGRGAGNTLGGLGNLGGGLVSNIGGGLGNLGNLGSNLGNAGNIGNLGNLIPGSRNNGPTWNNFPTTRRPSLLQIPGRIFNQVLGRNSTIQNLKRRIIPFNSGDSNRLIPFLPFIG